MVGCHKFHLATILFCRPSTLSQLEMEPQAIPIKSGKNRPSFQRRVNHPAQKESHAKEEKKKAEDESHEKGSSRSTNGMRKTTKRIKKKMKKKRDNACPVRY